MIDKNYSRNSNIGDNIGQIMALNSHNHKANNWLIKGNFSLDGLVKFDRLTTFNNVFITSHMGFLSFEALTNIAIATIENIIDYQKGKCISQLTNAI